MDQPLTIPNSSDARPLAAFIAVCILWGSTYLAIAFAIRTIPAFLMVGMRFTTADLLLFCWLRLRGERLPPIRTFVHSFITGLFLLTCGNTAVVFAEKHLSTGLAAIIVAALPLWMVVLDRRHWQESFRSVRVIVGLLIGFGGVIFLVTAGGSSVSFSIKDPKQLFSFLILAGGSFCWAVGSLYSKNRPVPGSTFMKGSIQMLTAGLTLLVASAIAGDFGDVHWASVSATSWLGLAYLIAFGSLVGYLSYIYVLSAWPASRAGTYAYVNPIVAVLLGWAILGEPMSAAQFVGLAVILGGVMLVNSRSLKLKKAE